MISILPFRLLIAAAAVLPSGWLYRAARALAPLAMPFAERRRQTVRNNIQRLQPAWEPTQLDAATRRVFQETAMYYVDTALLSQFSSQQILDDHTTPEGLDYVRSAIDAGNGVILVGAHLANPEVPFQALAALGIDALALVEPLADAGRMEAMRQRRETAGLPFVPATMEGVKRVITHLRGGGLVAILTDRDIQGQGSCVPFMRRLGQFPTGAVDLAMRTEATLLIGYAVREHDLHFRAVFQPTEPLIRSENRTNDIRANLANLIRLLEPAIQEHCDQWRMFESPWAPCHDTVYHDGGAPRPLGGTP
jgi:lauroyl/myristoyl acyltransferase